MEQFELTISGYPMVIWIDSRVADEWRDDAQSLATKKAEEFLRSSAGAYPKGTRLRLEITFRRPGMVDCRGLEM